MQLSRLLGIILVAEVTAGTTIVACGGGGSKNPDAKADTDATVGLTGLGEKCGSGLPVCPSAMDCVALQLPTGGATTAYCTPHCVDNGSGTTNPSGQFPGSGAGALTPPPDNSNCTAAYMGSIGMPVCGVILHTNPAPVMGALQANTAYTQVTVGCLIRCDATHMCPAGLTCNTQFSGAGLCFPN
jgi:hypothetical protein